MLVATPFASFASANNTYASFEDYCSFDFNDDLGQTYTPNHITNYNSDFAIVEVDPGMYELEFDCAGQVSQGELTVTVEGRSQDGLTTKDPATVIHSSTTTIDMTTSSQPIQIDATGSIGFVARVYVDIEAVDLNQNQIDLSNIIQVIPMINTTNDDTPRISFWYGKVNQHNENGTWMTDPDGVSGGGTSAQWGSEGWADRKLEYCQKFWPNTVAIEMREFIEKIDFSTRGNSQDYVSYKPVYDCIQSIENNTDENNTDDNSNLSCSLDLTVNPNQAYPGDTITASWTMTGDISSQMYVAVFSGWSPAQYYHSSIEQNTGSFSFILPSTLDHTLSYHVYIESADNNVGTEICWRYAAFDVLESDNNGTGDNGTGDNGTGDNGTGDNGTGDNGTGDNGTIGNGTDCHTCAHIGLTYISADHYSMDHKITTNAVDLNPGDSYTIDVVLVNEDTQTVVMTDTDSWVAATGIWYFVIFNLDLDAGEYCAYSDLYENGVWIDDHQGCMIIVCEGEDTDNNSNKAITEQDDDEGNTFTEDSGEDGQTKVENSSSDTSEEDEAVRYSGGSGGTDGGIYDTKEECEAAGGRWKTNAQGYSICMIHLKPEEEAVRDSGGTEQDNGEESEEEDSSIIGDIVQGILDAISEIIAEIFSETEKEEEKDPESEEESVESTEVE